MLRYFRVAGLSIVVFAALIVSLAGAVEDKTSVSFPVVEISFEQLAILHSRVQTEVETGNLDFKKGQQAKKIWVELQQRVSFFEAEILQLENDLINSKAEERLKTIRRISGISARRERLVISAYLGLKSVIDEDGFDYSISKAAKDESGRSDESSVEKTTIDIKLQSKDALIRDLE